jgi:hypothetical protein
VRGWPAADAGKKEGRGLEVEGEPDRWAPPVGEREREEREGGGGVGRLWAERGWAAGWVRLGGCFLFFFFSFLFKSNFKPISNLLNSNLFHLFKLKF